jgi:hypothetical protein
VTTTGQSSVSPIPAQLFFMLFALTSGEQIALRLTLFFGGLLYFVIQAARAAKRPG